jgi:ribosomally synthesized peptide (two-chain TOMM family)
MSSSSTATTSQWHVVWLKAVAKAWKDKAFEAELKKDPRKALKKEFNFEFPKSINFSVKETPAGATRSGATRSGGTRSAAKKAPSNEDALFEASDEDSKMCVHLHLPPAPADEEQAVALANLADETHKSCCGQPCC